MRNRAKTKEESDQNSYGIHPCRGIEDRHIFHQNDVDRGVFLNRLARILRETSTPSHAWALMRKLGIHQKSAERNPGDGESVLKKQEDQFERKYQIQARGQPFREIVERGGEGIWHRNGGKSESKQKAKTSSSEEFYLLLGH